MNEKQAKWAWVECCWDYDGPNGSKRSELGMVALARGVDGTVSGADLKRAAAFLREWADLIDPEGARGELCQSTRS